jgi:hypothetical protein
MNTYKDIYKRKKTMNDINPTTGLPMSGGGIDAGGTPYGNSSNGFDDETSGGSFNNIANYWSWKVDVVIMLIVIGVNIYFWID